MEISLAQAGWASAPAPPDRPPWRSSWDCLRMWSPIPSWVSAIPPRMQTWKPWTGLMQAGFITTNTKNEKAGEVQWMTSPAFLIKNQSAPIHNTMKWNILVCFTFAFKLIQYILKTSYQIIVSHNINKILMLTFDNFQVEFLLWRQVVASSHKQHSLRICNAYFHSLGKISCQISLQHSFFGWTTVIECILWDIIKFLVTEYPAYWSVQKPLVSSISELTKGICYICVLKANCFWNASFISERENFRKAPYFFIVQFFVRIVIIQNNETCLTSSSQTPATLWASLRALAGVRSAGGCQVIHLKICLPFSSRPRHALNLNEMIFFPFVFFWM